MVANCEEKTMNTIHQFLANKKHKEVISIAPHRPVYDALVILAEYKIGALAVLDGDKLVGIFSERDYAREVILKGKSSKETPVSELMTRSVFCVSPADTVDECMAIMNDKHVRHLPVLEDGKLTGIVSIRDVVNMMISEREKTIKDLEQYISS